MTKKENKTRKDKQQLIKWHRIIKNERDSLSITTHSSSARITESFQLWFQAPIFKKNKFVCHFSSSKSLITLKRYMIVTTQALLSRNSMPILTFAIMTKCILNPGMCVFLNQKACKVPIYKTHTDIYNWI